MVWPNMLNISSSRKQAKLQWLKDPNEVNAANVGREASIYFKNNKREYPKDRINGLATNSKNKNVRDLYKRIHQFKIGYQPRNNIMENEYVDLLAECHNVLNRWKNYFSQLLNVHNVSDIVMLGR
jgi:hypothetical protein